MKDAITDIYAIRNKEKKNEVFCDVCKTAVNATIELRRSGADRDVIKDILKIFCIYLYDSTDAICNAEVQIYIVGIIVLIEL